MSSPAEHAATVERGFDYAGLQPPPRVRLARAALAALVALAERATELEREDRRHLEMAAELEARAEQLETALRALANPDGIVRDGDLTFTRIPPHEFARAALDGAPASSRVEQLETALREAAQALANLTHHGCTHHAYTSEKLAEVIESCPRCRGRVVLEIARAALDGGTATPCPECGALLAETCAVHLGGDCKDPRRGTATPTCPHCGLVGKPYCWCGSHPREGINPTPDGGTATPEPS